MFLYDFQNLCICITLHLWKISNVMLKCHFDKPDCKTPSNAPAVPQPTHALSFGRANGPVVSPSSLMPPGIMVQLTSDHYCAEIPKACYDEVVIGKSMLSDHLPNVMLSNLLNTELWSKVVKLTDDGTPIRKGSSDDIQPNKEVTGLLDEKHEFRFKTFPVRLSEFETGVSCGCITKPRIKKYKKMTKTIYFWVDAGPGDRPRQKSARHLPVHF